MRSVTELHYDLKEISSEIKFLKQEIQFFLKLLSKQYAISINCCKIKLLDGYWKEFEKYESNLEVLELLLHEDEHSIALVSKTLHADSDKIYLNEDVDVYKEFFIVVKNIRTLKESFYAYMSESCQ